MSSAADNTVVFEDVNKTLGHRRVLVDVRLSLPSTQITAIVGESGSGKSTLLQHINALIRPDDGRVLVFGRPIDYDDAVALRRRVGYAVQSIALFPHLTVRNNVSLLARLENWPEERTETRIERLLSLMELDTGVLDRYPHELSGGQQQRVGLCRAMMLEPPLLLLDESFSGVDPITRQSIHEEFLRLQQEEPRTVVLVTHDMREAEILSDFLVVLLDGVVRQAAPTAEVIESPADEYVSRLVGDSPS
ncbi:MAG: ATP-binding cassette domain-containing protein [Gammaproteobacteria bacterium]